MLRNATPGGGRGTGGLRPGPATRWVQSAIWTVPGKIPALLLTAAPAVAPGPLRGLPGAGTSGLLAYLGSATRNFPVAVRCKDFSMKSVGQGTRGQP